MVTTTNLISYWKLDETSGNRADSHGANTLTDNFTVGNTTGKISNAADFIDTNTEFLSVADNADFSYSGAEDRSISLWFKPDSVSGVNTIISKWANSTDQEYILYTNGTSLVLGVLQQGAEVTKTSIAVGTWYHVVITMNSSKFVQMYVDAVSAGTKTSTGTVAGTTSELRIGQNSNTNYYDGAVDEVAFYTRILSAGDVTDLYNGGSALAYPFSTVATNSNFFAFF